MPASSPFRAFPLSPRNLARVEGWGMSTQSLSYMFAPRDVDGIKDVFAKAREHGTTVALRGGGRSYGDASINDDGIVLDLSRMNRILAWDPRTGIVETEPGVTIEKLWKTVVVDGWWPPVVSGTMFTTMAGCASMNIHGKNNFAAGTFGEHVLEFDLLLPSGEIATCSPERNADLYRAAIGGFGMLGCFVRLKLRMKKVHSGQLVVEAFRTRNLREMLDEIEERTEAADYLVGWVDCLARGRALGRGVVHQAEYLPEGVDPNPRETLRVAAQELPTKLFGVVPKSLMWWPLGFLMNDVGMRCVNAAKYHAGALQPRCHRYRQSHAAFAFLLDYVPNWKWAYKPGGLIQYQSFVPKESALHVFQLLLKLGHEAGMPSYLGVLKRHRPDPFLMTHSVDGFSLALDFKVVRGARTPLWDLCRRMDRAVLENGGRFYFAKDATLQREAIRRFFPAQNLAAFRALKRRCDPENILQTNLSRRLFGEDFG